MPNGNLKKTPAHDAAANGADGDSDSEINERLTELLRANAIKADQGATVADEPRLGFFAESYALISLIGLMIVAYIYTLLVNKDA